MSFHSMLPGSVQREEEGRQTGYRSQGYDTEVRRVGPKCL